MARRSRRHRPGFDFAGALTKDGVTLEGLDRAVARLEDAGANATHAREALTACGAIIFEEERARYGKGWKPDAPTTVHSKGNAEVGVEGGSLKESVTVPGSQYNVFDVHETALKFGSSAPHAHLFHYGHRPAAGKENRQRPRKLFRIRKRARRRMAAIITAWIVRNEY